MSNACGFKTAGLKGTLLPSAVVTQGTATPDGFIMESLKTFEDDYGFNQSLNISKGNGNADNIVTIGQAPDGSLHQLNAQFFKHRPAPGITSMNIEYQGQELYGKLRKATVNFKVFSPEQLDYIDNYFFNPSVSCFIDWGWTNAKLESIVNIQGEGNQVNLNEKGLPPRGIGNGLLNLWNDHFESGFV
jgi:hypothetical protein